MTGSIEDVVKQALLELRSRCFRARSEDGDESNADVLDELKDRCVALREALEQANVEVESKARKAEDLRAENCRLAQTNREILAAAQQVSLRVFVIFFHRGRFSFYASICEIDFPSGAWFP